MRHCTHLLAITGVALALTACNKSPTTPQPEPTTSPSSPTVTTPEKPSPSNTPSSSMPSSPTSPPAASDTPPTPSTQPQQSPSALPPPTNPPKQGGPNSMLTPEQGQNVATAFNPAYLRHATLDVDQLHGLPLQYAPKTTLLKM